MNVRSFFLAASVALTALAPIAAHADPPAPQAPVAAARGLAVVALDGAIDPAWALARSIYADPQLKPASLDEARARVLVGEAPAAGSPKPMTELAEIRGAIKGDDAPSRQLLASLARDLGVRGIVLVSPPPKPTARVFVAETGAFDAATYAPDDAQGTAWSATTRSLARSFSPVAPAPVAAPAPAPAPTLVPGPSLAVREGPRIDNAPPAPRKFYESGWFWGAIGAAAFAAGALYFATRDNSSGTIHLHMQVPK